MIVSEIGRSLWSQSRNNSDFSRLLRERHISRRCRLLCREECGSRRDNDIHFQLDELGSDLDEPLVASLRPAILDRDAATLDPTEVAQSLHKSGDPLAPG